MLFLRVLPIIPSLIYLIARGKGTQERSLKQQIEAEFEQPKNNLVALQT